MRKKIQNSLNFEGKQVFIILPAALNNKRYIGLEESIQTFINFPHVGD
jgi:hypothetical protein